MSGSNRIVALLSGPDRPGLVAWFSGWIFDRGGNILHADQHRDDEEGIFFQRIEWSSERLDPQEQAAAFRAFAVKQGMSARLALAERRQRVALFVSRQEHCFHDLILRWRAGELNGEIVCVISNHGDLAPAAKGYGIPFYHIPVRPGEQRAAEDEQLARLRHHAADVVVLARYMQVLSSAFLDNFVGSVINIHHSFLPAFAGGRPYHQAFNRGVKLIGATAHYATPILDDGPIIEQDVARVSHRDDVRDLVRRGKDLERIVLARAVSWHLENRVLVYRNKTVVFD